MVLLWTLVSPPGGAGLAWTGPERPWHRALCSALGHLNPSSQSSTTLRGQGVLTETPSAQPCGETQPSPQPGVEPSLDAAHPQARGGGEELGGLVRIYTGGPGPMSGGSGVPSTPRNTSPGVDQSATTGALSGLSQGA